jgi:hypothetical protein
MGGGAGQIGSQRFPALMMTSGASVVGAWFCVLLIVSSTCSFLHTHQVDALQLLMYAPLHIGSFLHVTAVHVLINIATCHPRCPSWVNKFKYPLGFLRIICRRWFILGKPLFDVSHTMPITKLMLGLGYRCMAGIDFRWILVGEGKFDIRTASAEFGKNFCKYSLLGTGFC